MNILWCDVETGGLSPDLHDVTQIGAVFEVDGHVAQELNLFVCPDPDRVTAKALEIQNRTLEQVLRHPLSVQQAGRVFGAALDEWDEGAGTPINVGGQNPKFDIGFIGCMVPGVLRVGRLIDLIPLARAKLPRLMNHKLPTICAELGIQFKAHDALEDARAARLAYRKLEAMR